MYEILVDILWKSWFVLCDIAPYLLFGFAIAGLMSIWISPEWTERHLGGRGIRPVVKAALLGIPLPLCSCAVIPVVASMRRHGASRAAATSFLLSTPQTGVDSILVTYSLLGGVFAIFRPIAALICGMIGGAMVLLFGQSASGTGGTEETPECADSCCTGDRSRPVLFRAARYGLVTLPRDLAVPLLIGIVVAGVLTALVKPGQLNVYLGNGIVSILAMMAAGIPLYVCATASVPIAAGLVHMGASPGAALAFLIVGAATNPAGVAMVWKIMGRRTALLYLLTVAISALLCALLLDGIFVLVQAWIPDMAAHEHSESVGPWSAFWAVALLAVLVCSYVEQYVRRPALRRNPSKTPPEGGTPTGHDHTCCHAAKPHSHGA